MSQQWNQWEIPLTITPQTGRYWGDLPSTHRINFPPTDTWAYTYLSTMRVFEENQSAQAFAQASFVNYDYLD